MEYVVLRALHPTWLSFQLPGEVAEFLRFDPQQVRSLRNPGRGILFLSRGPGVVRVTPALQAADIIGIETVQNRFISQARVSGDLLLSLPAAVIRHLGIQTRPRGEGSARATDDMICFFLPAPEYFEFRARSREAKGWTGPSGGGLPHMYLARSLLPFPSSLDDLTKLEHRIESEDWRPRIEALSGVPRGRR
jgi:hypothetical protein